MENPLFMENLLWFVIGAAGYRMLVTLSGYLELQSFAKKIDISALLLVGKVLQDSKFGRNLKYTYLKETGMPPVTLTEIKEKDIKELDEWKAQTFNYFLTAYPRRYLHKIDFGEWEQVFGTKIKK